MKKTLGWYFAHDPETRRRRLLVGAWVPEVPCEICAQSTTNAYPYCDEHTGEVF